MATRPYGQFQGLPYANIMINRPDVAGAVETPL